MSGSAPLRLRPTRTEDLDFVLRIEADPDYSRFIGSWSHAEHAAAFESPGTEHQILESRDGEAPCGYVITHDLRRSGHGVYLKRLAVRPRGKGLGREALRLVAEHAFRELGASHLWLAVRANNEGAARLYARLGFEAVASLLPRRGRVMELRPERVRWDDPC